MYGSDCDLSHLVMEAINQTKVNMQVTLGIYVSPEGDYTAYDRQKVAITDVLKKYGADNIAGITGESSLKYR